MAWDYADLVCQDMSSLRMARATGQGIRGTGANFDRSNLPSAWFKRGELNASRFQFARMDDINLEEANMERSNLYGAEARNSNLVGATLDAANLAHGDFSGADFSNAHFMLADLRGTDFHGANFANAVLQDADISGANFKGARNITQAMLDSACRSSSHGAVVDSPLTSPSRKCFADAKKEQERMVRRLTLMFAAQAVVIQGYCKDGIRVLRQPDSNLHPDDNTRIYLDPAMLEGPLQARESYE